MGWQNTALVLHSSKEERRGKRSAPKPGCTISAGSEWQEELVHAVGMAVGFGSEGRSREGTTHSKGSPVVGGRGKHKVQ